MLDDQEWCSDFHHPVGISSPTSIEKEVHDIEEPPAKRSPLLPTTSPNIGVIPESSSTQIVKQVKQLRLPSPCPDKRPINGKYWVRQFIDE